MRVVLKIQYDGTNFNGWQRQREKRTVQGVIEDAVFELTGEHCTVTASGRTDSGVHAKCQIAHFDTNCTIPADKLCFALNALLPEDVSIFESFEGDENFHSRFSAKRKTYRYTFYLSRHPLPLEERFATRIDSADVEKMQQAAKYIIGERDFKCFLASNSDVKSTVRTVYSCDVEQNGIFITITVCGNGFLYNMVRTIAGTLLYIGMGKMPPEQMQQIIDGKDRNLAGKTVAAKGLTLLSVEYDN